MESTTMGHPKSESTKAPAGRTKNEVMRTKAVENSLGVGGDKDTDAPPLLSHLLAMAQKYQRLGQIRQAMDLYWELVDDYPESEAGNVARTTLLELAQRFERGGKLHVAREIYEHLLQLQVQA